MTIKTHHKTVTPNQNADESKIKQLESRTFSVFYRIFNYVCFTAIVDPNYPTRLLNAFLEIVSTAFFDEAKCVLGSSDIHSRIENIEGSHFFVRFDRIIKQKKKEFDDPNSGRNIDRLKKELEFIQEITRESMGLLDKRTEDLKNVQQKAYGINEEAKKFEKKSKDLVWHLWIRKNLIWIVLVLGVILLYYLF